MDKYKISKKVEKAVRFNHKLWKNGGKTITWALAFFIIGIMSKSMWDGYWRTHEWSWQTPIIFQTPLIIKEIKPLSQKVLYPIPEAGKSATMRATERNLPIAEPTHQQIVDKAKHSDIINKIWMLETTKGTNTNPYALHNICKDKGMTNEFGYAAQCFPSFEYTVLRVDAWITKQLKTKTLAQTLCYYNTGYAMDSCNYYLTYKSL